MAIIASKLCNSFSKVCACLCSNLTKLKEIHQQQNSEKKEDSKKNEKSKAFQLGSKESEDGTKSEGESEEEENCC